MNELRWILLVIGILLVAGLYFWEVFKQKRFIRSRIENYPAFSKGQDSDDLTIKPDTEENEDVIGAIADLNIFLNESRKDISQDTETVIARDTAGQFLEAEQQPAGQIDREPYEQKIIVLYITARGDDVFTGIDIREAVESAGMRYGTMDIYHYPDVLAGKNLFSLANLHEPGTFNLDTITDFTTNGLAMFLCLPASRPGDQSFEKMLNCARHIAADLNGDLRSQQNKLVTKSELDQLRQEAAQYS